MEHGERISYNDVKLEMLLKRWLLDRFMNKMFSIKSQSNIVDKDKIF